MGEEDEGNAHPGTSASTPNSTSAAPSGVKAAKDRKCPFCAQAFTSSSLGRHLDLYIKPKNPKPPDGVHDVVEIRKLRGGITRRQPRTSVRGTGGSVSNNDPQESVKSHSNSATPSAAARRPARTDYGRVVAEADDSPAASPRSPEGGSASRAGTTFNSANWQATGVINNLPPREPSRNAMRPETSAGTGQAQRVHDMRHDAGGNRFQRPEYENEGMWKLQEAAEMGRAAEMALREVLGSLEAAQKTVTPQHLYEDFDYFALNFPGLSLAVLPPPSTLFSPTPFPSADSWTLDPPSQRQFDTMARLLNERVALRRKTEHISDTLFFKYHAHLAGAWEHWQGLSDQDRATAWNLEILRAVSRGQDQQRHLRTRLEQSEQRVRHLETEYDRLSRCQLPREYLMHPPNTTPVPTNVMREVRPSQFKSEVAAMGYDAEAILGKWRSTIRATTRRPTHVNQSSSTPAPQPQKRTTTMQDDMMMNGAVWTIGGPMPRDRPAHTNESDVNYVSYQTPPEPGAVLGGDREGPSPADADADADGEAEDVSMEGQGYGGHGTALVRRRIGGGTYADANGGGTLNVNGKRPLDADAAGGRSGAPKLYKEHVEDHEQGD